MINTFGEHPLVTRFLKGVFELKPSLLRHAFVWDVGTVLRYMQSMTPMTDMTLAMLTKKLTTLLALVTALRWQTLTSSESDIAFVQETQNKLIFTIREKLKTTRPAKHLEPIAISPYPQDLRICLVAHIKHYIAKTKPNRQHSKLLISYVKPYQPVTNSTVVRW